MDTTKNDQIEYIKRALEELSECYDGYSSDSELRYLNTEMMKLTDMLLKILEPIVEELSECLKELEKSRPTNLVGPDQLTKNLRER